MYRPGFVPQNPADLPQYLAQEQTKVLQEFVAPKEYLVMQVNHVAPRVPSDNLTAMLAIADGSDWDPGSGAGLYRYQNGSWTFIG